MATKTVTYRLFVWFETLTNLASSYDVYELDGEEVWSFDGTDVWRL